MKNIDRFNSKNSIANIIFYSTTFILVFILNLKTTYIGDDFIYRFFYLGPDPTTPHHVITTATIPQSMFHHYFLWNGRLVAHSIVQFFMQFPSKIPFNVVNSLAFLFLIYLISKIISQLTQKKANPFLLSLIAFLLWFELPMFGQTVLWLSGSGNYLWMSLIYLGFIYFCITHPDKTIFNLIIAIVLGILSGVTNENSGPAALCIVGFFVLIQYFWDKKINWNALIGILFGVLSFYIMVESPGSKMRNRAFNGMSTIILNCHQIKNLVLHRFLPIYLGIILAITIGILIKKITFKRFVYSMVFLVGHVLAMFAMVLSTDFPIRTLFGSILFLLISLLILVYPLINEIPAKFMVPILIILIFVFIPSYQTAYESISYSENQVIQQMELIEKSKTDANGNAVVSVISKPNNSHNPYLGTVKIEKGTIQWLNEWEAKFFGIKSITGD